MPRPSSRTDASRRRTLVVLVLTALVATLGLTGTAQAATTIPAGALFIAPSGSDSNPCTQASPCKTWQKALTSGKVFVARGGTYTRDEAFTPGRRVGAAELTRVSAPCTSASCGSVVPATGVSTAWP
jgi:hypothetical protein